MANLESLKEKTCELRELLDGLEISAAPFKNERVFEAGSKNARYHFAMTVERFVPSSQGNESYLLLVKGTIASGERFCSQVVITCQPTEADLTVHQATIDESHVDEIGIQMTGLIVGMAIDVIKNAM